MRINLIAAVADNGVIGREGGMPWHLPADFAWFKQHTMGHPVIMGRKTYQSIGRALPGRRNIVVSRDANWSAPGCEAAPNLDAALDRCADATEVFVIGGGQLYASALERADRIVLTNVDARPEGDVRFPALAPSDWLEVFREHRRADAQNAHDMEFVIYQRRVR
ncbi:MAG TPA: type 3 dihydrofolate reductase [Usitatibacteraceae bacterium]|nr:type 3 dihydrofolate reductase [Usitatibacteraceae bacterium]